MDLPFAASDTYSFFVLMITFGMLIIGFAIIIFPLGKSLFFWF